MARSTKEEAEKTRHKILSAALDVILDKGFANTSLDQIAKAAQVTRGAIYWHFKNKTDLFTALFDDWISPSEALACEYLIGEPPSLANLKAYMVAWLQQIEQNAITHKLFHLVFFNIEHVGEIKVLIEKANIKANQDTKALQVYLGVLKSEKILEENIDTSILAISLGAFLMGHAQSWLSRPEAYSLAESAPVFVEYFFSGYSNNNG